MPEAGCFFCILRIVKIGSADPLTFKVKKRNSQKTNSPDVVCAGARRGAEHLRIPPFLPFALSLRNEGIHQFQGPTTPVDLLLSGIP
jgi:hypothetical protein